MTKNYDTHTAKARGYDQAEKIFETIKILVEIGEKDLAFQLRVFHDTHLRLGWERTR